MKQNVFIKDKLKKIALSKYLKKELKKAGFIDVDVIRAPLSTRIVIYALKPGFVIGKKGSTIRSLTEDISKRFDYSKVHIEIGEIPNKSLDAKVVIENITNNIARGISWKSAVYRALSGIKEAGAIGAEIVAKGNIAGKGQRKRKSRFFFGYMKKAGEQKNLVFYEKRTAFPKLGTIGIKLRIVLPDTLFSDKIDVLALSKEYKLKLEAEAEKRKAEKLDSVSKDDEKSVTKKKEVKTKKTTKKVADNKKKATKKVTKKKEVLKDLEDKASK